MFPTPSTTFQDDPQSRKVALRREYRARRAAIGAEEAAAAARRVADHVLQHLTDSADLTPSCAIAAYWPMAGELDTCPLLETLAARHYPCLLPCSPQPATPMVFRHWYPGDPLVRSAAGVMEPTLHRPIALPSVVLVPLLAFDAHGYRLGYGGGYYDRTLAHLKAQGLHPRIIGLGYALQEADTLPREPHDQPLHLIITEGGLRTPSAA